MCKINDVLEIYWWLRFLGWFNISYIDWVIIGKEFDKGGLL